MFHDLEFPFAESQAAVKDSWKSSLELPYWKANSVEAHLTSAGKLFHTCGKATKNLDHCRMP